MLRKWLKRLRDIWELAKKERASPKQIGWAVGIGVFCGCTPAVGFHGWVAVAAATVLKLNRLWAWIGSRISNILILPFIVWAEIDIAHWMRTSEHVVFDKHHVLEEAHLLFLDWCIGCVIVGAALGTIFGVIAYFVCRSRRSRRGPLLRRKTVRRKPAPDPQPSSESPPSDSTVHPS